MTAVPWFHWQGLNPTKRWIMARRASEPVADTPAVEERHPKAYSGSLRPAGTERQGRNGVPISRGQRAQLDLPVFVYGRSSTREPLLRLARTLVVHAHGALVALDAAVEREQELILINPKTGVETGCRVTAFEPKKNGCKPVVEVEFTRPAPGFWGLVFPPEDWDPAERKLPRTPRRFRRVRCCQPVRVRPTEESGNHFDDVCVTENISPGSVYFHSGHHGYSMGMRLAITFLDQADFFAPHTNYASQIVRVDQSKDGRVGVAVKLFGRINGKLPTTSTSSQRKIPTDKLGAVSSSTPSNRGHLSLGKRIRIVCWPVPSLGRMLQLTSNGAKALTRIWNTGANLYKKLMARPRYRGRTEPRHSFRSAAAVSGNGAFPSPTPDPRHGCPSPRGREISR